MKNLTLVFIFSIFAFSAHALSDKKDENRFFAKCKLVISIKGPKQPDIEEPIEVGLYRETPKTSLNFAVLASQEWEAKHGASYHGCPFHRIIENFMMQGGDFTNKNGTGGMCIYPGGKFKDENFIVKHTGPYLLSMANAGPNTNGSQFFITFAKTEWLNGKHVVFGEVTKNRELIDLINELYTDKSSKPPSVSIVTCEIISCSESFLTASKEFINLSPSIPVYKDMVEEKSL